METKDRGEFRVVSRRLRTGADAESLVAELNPDEREFPGFHVATSTKGAKYWVEQMARVDGLLRRLMELVAAKLNLALGV